MNIQDTGIDIIVLNCNNDGFIQKCLTSIKENTPAPYNLIVIDQNSSDGSKEWISDSGIPSHIIYNKMNLGIGASRNQGIRAGKYPWIVFIDSDIEIKDKEWVDKMWNYTIDHHIGVIEAKIRLYSWDSKEVMYAGMAFNMVRRQCFNEIGIFDPNFIITDDIEWWVRLEYSNFWKTAYCPDTNICHFRHKTLGGCLKSKWDEFKAKEEVMLRAKYTDEFIKKTYYENSWRRDKLTKELQGG